MKICGVAILITWCASAWSVQAGESLSWNGPYAEIQHGIATGSHALSYTVLGREFPLYDFGLESERPLQAFGLGYRYHPDSEQFVLGVELMIRDGLISGREVWSADVVPISAELNLSAKTLVTLALQVGYTPEPSWLVYAEAGLGAADLSVSITAAGKRVRVSYSEDGWAPSKYFALGISHQPRRGFLRDSQIGAEAQYFGFEASENVVSGRPVFGHLNASADIFQLALTIGWKF